MLQELLLKDCRADMSTENWNNQVFVTPLLKSSSLNLGLWTLVLRVGPLRVAKCGNAPVTSEIEDSTKLNALYQQWAAIKLRPQLRRSDKTRCDKNVNSSRTGAIKYLIPQGGRTPRRRSARGVHEVVTRRAHFEKPTARRIVDDVRHDVSDVCYLPSLDYDRTVIAYRLKLVYLQRRIRLVDKNNAKLLQSQKCLEPETRIGCQGTRRVVSGAAVRSEGPGGHKF
ncbi:hypothetical protein EVAR_83616_1 [Eumeta japonica]|uniref:Uncharacterized protein n=1 Tax=Eumeta variegata TaxID=151549 RepID=A0A4C1UNH7_EUMVA|nr:hypothetical protein EVAR_83616_1 [Eumeta japonica]